MKITKEKTEKEKYTGAVGRRKTSTARVRIFEASKDSFIVNDKTSKEYFATDNQRKLIQDPITKGLSAGALEKAGFSDKPLKFKIEVKVSGGGINSQAEAVRHGLARALVKLSNEFKQEIKDLGYLKRDPRSKERRKFGLKKARKAPQWSKR
jgi:small subunit ribosomal protein S9